MKMKDKAIEEMNAVVEVEIDQAIKDTLRREFEEEDAAIIEAFLTRKVRQAFREGKKEGLKTFKKLLGNEDDRADIKCVKCFRAHVGLIDDLISKT